jgi:hypothetical protein
MPPNIADGAHTVYALGTSGSEATFAFTELAASAFSINANQSLSSLPGTITGGAVGYFASSENVTIHLDSATGTVLTTSPATVTTGTSGQASGFSITIPANTASGTHTLVAVGNTSGLTATSNAFTVSTIPTASAPVVSASVTYGANPIWVNGKSNESVTLTDSPTDAGGTGVASVAYYYCPSSAGTCTSSTPWISIGSSSSGPSWSVAWSSSSLPADGTYNVVAVATGDDTNESPPSAPTLVGIDTTPPVLSPPSVNGIS